MNDETRNYRRESSLAKDGSMTNLSTDELRDVARYIQNHPGSDVVDVLGGFALPPSAKPAVEELVMSDNPLEAVEALNTSEPCREGKGEKSESGDGEGTESDRAITRITGESEPHGAHIPENRGEDTPEEPETSDDNPTLDTDKNCSSDDYEHDNPIDRSDVTDDDRADMLREYLEEFVDAFGQVPRLMPLDEEGKAPIIQGNCKLDSPEGRSYLVDGEEAITQIREGGARGFAIYAGKPDHNTENVVLVDVDDRETFPYESFEDTLEVLSGSGRGEHFTYSNDAGDIENAKGKGDVDGEVRAKNWYCVTPGSIHPTGGVYHVTEPRDVVDIEGGDIPESLRPGTSKRNRTKTVPDSPDEDAELPDSKSLQEQLERAFENPHDGDKMEDVYHGRYTAAGFRDRSSAEFWFANRVDSWVGHGNRRKVERVMDSGYLQKWQERPDDSYRDSILSEVGYQDWYFQPDEGDTPEDAYGEHVAVLPNAPVERADRFAGLSADKRHLSPDLSLDTVRNRTQNAIEDALGHGDRVLIESLPSAGKTTGSIKAAAETGEQITYLAPRREVMADVAEKARNEGLDVYTLPSFPVHCPTASGEHGDEWRKTVMDWYERGASPKDIHANAEYELSRPLPCQEHDEQECPYTSMWRFDPDDYDVLVGHYNHGHKETVTQGRTVVFDEFPASSYETELSTHLEASVTAFLKATPEIPYTDYADLMEHRRDEQKRSDALLWFTEEEPDEEPRLVFNSDYAHAKAPLAVFTMLAASKHDLGNGWERCELPDGGVGLFNREDNRVRLLESPKLDYASAVVALDGTPTKQMWELSLGTRLNRRQVLSDEERRDYITDVLGLNLIQTSAHMKPYNNPDYVNLEEDAALLEGIEKQHGQRPTVITTLSAERTFIEEGVIDEDADRYEHHGNLKSSNEFATNRLGCIFGSSHYGDGYIQKWGAYAGEVVERNGEKGIDLSYGEFGDEIYRHMTHNETLQAAMRFGRDGNGATVYVHTAALPDWVPVAGEGRVINTWSDGMKQVLDAANGLDSWRTRDIAEHPSVEIGERQVRDHLETLAERGYVDRETEGRGYVWQDDGLHEVSDTGEVEIDVVADEDVVAEVSRKSIYTWEFRNSEEQPPGSSNDPPSAGDDETPDVLADGGRDGAPPG